MGVDLTAYKADILAASEKTYNTPSCEHSSLFLDHLYLRGFRGFDRIEYGAIIRISDIDDKANKKSAWYIFYQNETVSIGIYGSWKRPEEKNVWYSKNESTLTFNERIEVNNQIKEAQAKQIKAREEQNENAAKEAEEAFNNLPPGS